MGYIKEQYRTTLGSSGATSSTNGMILISSQSGSGTQFLNFLNIPTGTYDTFCLYFSAVNCSGNGQLYMQFSQDGGATWITSYHAGVISNLYNSITLNNGNDTSTAVFTANSGTASYTSGRMYIFNSASSPFLIGNFTTIGTGSGILTTGFNGNQSNPGSPINPNSLRIGVSGALNINSGIFSLYGMIQ